MPAELSFTIINSLGIEIARFNDNNINENKGNNIKYNIENLPSGVYFLNMNAGKTNKTVKFVVFR
jgi:hypothetical protein